MTNKRLFTFGLDNMGAVTGKQFEIARDKIESICVKGLLEINGRL